MASDRLLAGRRVLQVAIEDIVDEALGAHLVQRGTDVDPDWLTDIATLGVTAGASAPETLVREVIDAVAAVRSVVEDVVVTAEENMVFKLPRELAD